MKERLLKIVEKDKGLNQTIQKTITHPLSIIFSILSISCLAKALCRCSPFIGSSGKKKKVKSIKTFGKIKCIDLVVSKLNRD